MGRIKKSSFRIANRRDNHVFGGYLFFMSVFKYIFLCQDFGQKCIKKEPRRLRGSNVSYCLTENQNITDFFAWSWKCMSWYI